MTFDWKIFLESRGVEFSLSGKNVQRGHAAIACPLCGDDPSHHLNVSLSGPDWRCWRNSAHRGRTPYRLVAAICRCSAAEAARIVGEPPAAPLTGLAGLMARAAALFDATEALTAPAAPISPPGDFRPLAPVGPRAVFWEYLIGRGFGPPDIGRLCAAHDLRCALSGPDRMRLILPVIRNGVWWAWTARAIGPATLRYRAYPAGPAAKQNIFNGDGAAAGGKLLVVTEGALGALKVDFYGKPAGIRAVATLGAEALPAQARQIARLAPGYRRVVLAFDPGAEAAALALVARLGAVRPLIIPLPLGLSGPDDMEPAAVVSYFRRYVDKV